MFGVAITYLLKINETALALFIIGLALTSEILCLLNKKEKRINLRLIVWTLLIANFIGIFWLYKTAYYDSLMHITWGALIGVLIFEPVKKITRKNILIKTVLFVTIIGIIWELGEYTWDILFAKYSSFGLMQPSHFDTIKDIIFDTLGGFIGAKLIKKSN